jgi:Flp pilus assembly pilin Flp
MKALLSRFVTEEHGQDLIEYALLAGFISLAAVAAITSISTELATIYQNTEEQVKKAADKAP